MLSKLATVAIAFILLSTVAIGIVSASPNEQAGVRSASLDFHIAVITDATDKGVFTDVLHDVLADHFIENLIAPHTGETPEQIRERLRTPIPSSPLFHIAVIIDATDKGVFADALHDALADYFIENLIAPHTGETPAQIRNRLSAQPGPANTPLSTPTASATTTPIPSGTPTIAQLVKNVQGGVVQIIALTGSGSGFIIDSDGRVATNQHVVSGNQSVTVRMHDGTEYPASVLGVDAVADLAIVDIAPEITLTPVPLGDSSLVQVGEEVVAMGYPLGHQLGQSQTVTKGIVSSRRPNFQGSGVEHLQTDAAINPGNSGGPLFNRAGEVIGVNTSRRETTDDGRPVTGISFAVSINELKSRLETLKGSGSPQPVTTPTPVPTPATPVPTPAAAPTPPPLPAGWNRYENGVYGFSVDTPPGWRLNEDTQKANFAYFRAPDNKASVAIQAYDLSTSYSLQALAEWNRNWWTDLARDESWNVFEMTSFSKKRESGKEFYELVFRAQSSSEFCVDRVTDRTYISSWYPDKPHGYRIATWVCEHSLNRYSANAGVIQNSFTEWMPYWNATHAFGLNVAPGWTLETESETDDYATFWAPDQVGVFNIQVYEVSASTTLEDFVNWRMEILNSLGDSWEVYEPKGIVGSGGVVGAREEYLISYVLQSDSEHCVTDREELLALSSFHPEHPYGFLVITGVCQHSKDLYNNDRWEMIHGFRY